MKIVFLLTVFWIQTYIVTGAIPNCCTSKNVGGLEYNLLRVEDTSQYNCLTNCVYEKIGEPGLAYCFGAGDQKVECKDEGCCNKLDVHTDRYSQFTGTYTKQTTNWNNRVWYRTDDEAKCIWYDRWWKLSQCDEMNLNHILGYVLTSPLVSTIMCPGDVWLNWKYINWCDRCGPVDPTIVIDCISSSSLTQEVGLSVSAGYLPKTLTEKTEIATLISNITSEESIDSRGKFKCCKGPVSIGDCPTATIGIATIKVFLSVDNGQTTTNGDAVSDLCNTQSSLPSTTLLIVYEPTSQTATEEPTSQTATEEPTSQTTTEPTSQTTTEEPIQIQCPLCRILLSSCCADETSVYKTNCRSYFRFYCYWLDCCACGFAQDNSTCLYGLCKNTPGCYKAYEE